MANKEKNIYVYECWSSNEPCFMGTLFVDCSRLETYSFEYDSDWLRQNTLHQFTIDPNLEFYQGRQYPNGKNLFGIFSDSSPDRWGRVLMKRREALLAKKENRKPKKLQESDYLLGVYDKTRMGALRFKLEKDGPFISDDQDEAVPPMANLRDLEAAARGFEISEDKENEVWLRQLIKPGSSLGGARPKATVQDTDGNLWIAKFPSQHDEYDIGAWEKVTSELARLCGLNVPETELKKFSKLGSTFLTKRFDREKEKRIHFTSAMTMLGKEDGASAEDGSGYLDIVSLIKTNGCNPKDDIRELWKRIIFNMAVSNTDDHLRNHGFILHKYGWRLSPLYDVNPIPYGNELSLNVTYSENSISISLLKEFANQIDISEEDAENDIRFVLKTVRDNWERLALAYGISHESINYMRQAFLFSDEKEE